MSNFVPVCGPVVAWVNAFLSGQESSDDTLHGIACAGAAPVVTGPDSVANPWAFVLGRMRSEGVSALRLALAAPGDIAELPGPPELNRVALDLGECALTIGGLGSALLPVSDDTWLWAPAADARQRGIHLGDANRQLAEAMGECSAELESLDVARGRASVDDVLGHIDVEFSRLILPTSFPSRALVLIRRAVQVSAAISVAVASEGGALTVNEVERRARALSPVAHAARRAIEAGFSANPLSSAP